MKENKKAFLIAVSKEFSEKHLLNEHLDELSFLAKTHGFQEVGRMACFVRKFEAATLITKGKLQECLDHPEMAQTDVVLFDEEISPSQQKNLEKIFKKPVIDRAGLILEVFADRAETREAKLQVELAKLRYEAPRLKNLWSHLSRQKATAGSGAYLKGEGEKQIEIDRRILKDKIDRLKKQIHQVAQQREQQRGQRTRKGIPLFALVGYTNAGKSTLLNQLTDADVFVEDKLFATLDTTTRKMTLPNHQEVLVIDTVGFIRKLPHLLVAAFKSTLEESVKADILLHVIDVTHPDAEQQAETTINVLHELGATDQPIITILNKVDQLEDKSVLQKFRLLYPHTVPLSAKAGEGFEALFELMTEEMAKMRSLVHLRIPQSEYGIVTEVQRLGTVIKKDFEENDVLLEVDLPVRYLTKVAPYREKE